ncbi:Bax inhibitor-1/YccA family protein [Rhodocyclus purpureus]|uniref:Bax inhibitor-1/YccA family protein n=1 Tax=Rhodocyclus purpureus TaxID=1067 RepID=UPI003B835408|nr:BAX inhibitor protein [Rhodocyclus purpureus]
MNMQRQSSLAASIERASPSLLSTHRVLRNTYALLALTLLFSGGIAALTASLKLPHPGIIVTLVGYFGLLFLTTKLRNSGWGLLSVFGLTGFMGYTLGPIIAHYLALPNGGQTVALAMGGTGVIFLALSAYALVSRKDFSFLGGFLMVGVLTVFLASLAAVFFTLPALSLAVAAACVLLMSGLILFETSNIIHGGETNYIMATVSLFVSLYNLFASLLQLLGIFGGDD